MANIRINKDENLMNIIVGMTPTMIGQLDKIALDKQTSRNAIIRAACEVLINKLNIVANEK